MLRTFGKVNPTRINRQSSFEELGLDSSYVIELVVAIEYNFNLTLTIDQALSVISVLDGITVFSKHKSK